jgi:predicted Zn-dependent peptidase
MELLGYIAIAAVFGFVGWLCYLGYQSTQFKETVEDIKEELEEIEEFIESIPTPAELKKMTKAKLLDLASELGIEVDSKKKKAEIVEELEKKR